MANGDPWGRGATSVLEPPRNVDPGLDVVSVRPYSSGGDDPLTDEERAYWRKMSVRFQQAGTDPDEANQRIIAAIKRHRGGVSLDYSMPDPTPAEQSNLMRSAATGLGKAALSVAGTVAANSIAPGSSIPAGIALRSLGSGIGYFAGDVGEQLIEGVAPSDVDMLQSLKEAGVVSMSQAAPEASGAILARLGGVGPGTIANTLKTPMVRGQYRQLAPGMLGGRNLGPEAEMVSGRQVLQSADDLSMRLPQIAPRSSLVDDTALSAMEKAERTRIQNAATGRVGATRETGEAAVKAARGQQEAMVSAAQAEQRVRLDAAKKHFAEAESRTAAAMEKGNQALGRIRVETGDELGQRVNSVLSRAEGSVTESRLAKIELLREAEKSGVTIDTDGLISSIKGMVDETNFMRGAQQANKNLDDLLKTIEAKYGDGPLTPVQADDLLQIIRENVKNAFSTEGGVSEMQRSFMGLQKQWKDKIYDTLEGAGALSRETRMQLTARENLRDMISDKKPSAFVDALQRGDVGSREMWRALRDFEATHKTGGVLEKEIVGFANRLRRGEVAVKSTAAKRSASASATREDEARLTSDMVAAERTKGTRMVRATQEEARRNVRLVSGRVKAETQKATAELDATMAAKRKELDIAKMLNSGQKRAAFMAQKSTAEQQRMFEAIDKIEGFVSEKTPESVIGALRSAMTGTGDKAKGQSLIKALREFEAEAGTGGRLEANIRKITQRRDWQRAHEYFDATRTWKIVSEIGTPAARAVLLSARPLSAFAASTSGFTKNPLRRKSERVIGPQEKELMERPNP